MRVVLRNALRSSRRNAMRLRAERAQVVRRDALRCSAERDAVLGRNARRSSGATRCGLRAERA